MNITRAIRKGRSIVGNDQISKVSEAEIGDSVFFDSEAEKATKLARVNEILATRNMVVVDRFTKTERGSLRSFIGDANYVAPSTALE